MGASPKCFWLLHLSLCQDEEAAKDIVVRESCGHRVTPMLLQLGGFLAELILCSTVSNQGGLGCDCDEVLTCWNWRATAAKIRAEGSPDNGIVRVQSRFFLSLKGSHLNTGKPLLTVDSGVHFPLRVAGAAE